MHYQKRFEMQKSKKDKSLGFKLKLFTSPESGALTAMVSDVIPDGLADRSGHEGCRMEEGDELTEINGIRIANCNNAEVVKLLQEPELSLTLQAVIPGSEADVGTGEEGDIYTTARSSGVFHNVKVNPSDFIALSSAT